MTKKEFVTKVQDLKRDIEKALKVVGDEIMKEHFMDAVAELENLAFNANMYYSDEDDCDMFMNS